MAELLLGPQLHHVPRAAPGVVDGAVTLRLLDLRAEGGTAQVARGAWVRPAAPPLGAPAQVRGRLGRPGREAPRAVPPRQPRGRGSALRPTPRAAAPSRPHADMARALSRPPEQACAGQAGLALPGPIL